MTYHSQLQDVIEDQVCDQIFLLVLCHSVILLNWCSLAFCNIFSSPSRLILNGKI